MGDPVVHFEIVGKEPERLRSFYRDAFKWKIDPPSRGAGDMDYTIVRTADSDRTIGGGIGKCPDGYDGHVTFYIAVDDVAAALRKVESLGGTTMMGAEQVPDGPVIGLFKDPEGHVVGVVEAEG